MIELFVEDYCQKCEDFEPTVNRIYSDDHILAQDITCVHRDRCERICAALFERLEKKRREQKRGGYYDPENRL